MTVQLEGRICSNQFKHIFVAFVQLKVQTMGLGYKPSQHYLQPSPKTYTKRTTWAYTKRPTSWMKFFPFRLHNFRRGFQPEEKKQKQKKLEVLVSLLCPRRNFGWHNKIATSIRPHVRTPVCPHVRPLQIVCYSGLFQQRFQQKTDKTMHLTG